MKDRAEKWRKHGTTNPLIILVYYIDNALKAFIVVPGFNFSISWEIFIMTKFVAFASVLAVLAVAACSTAPAQRESVVYGDRTFSNAQNK
jgi:hypothetical protein